MKPQRIIYSIVLLLVISSNYQCSSSKPKFEETTAVQCSRVFFQDWIANIKDGGSGINMFLPNLTAKPNITLDSVYFRNLKGKLVKGRATYTARLTKPNPYDVNMSSEEYGEYGNKLPNKKKAFPFDLKNNECVISYTENGVTKYIKKGNVKEKAGEYYPDGTPKN